MLVRSDLGMNAGKAASQASHAALDAYLQALALDPTLCEEYKDKHHGIKVCLAVDSLDKLLLAESKAKQLNLPNALIHDLGYTCFEGQLTITALGIGPVRKDQIKSIVGSMPLFKS